MFKVKKSLKIKLKKENILKRLGYNKALPSKELEEEIDKIIKEATKLIEPKAVFDLYMVNTSEWGFYLQKWTTESYFQSFFLSEKLEGIKCAYLFAATIGSKLEKEVNEAFSKNDYLRGYLLDCIGSEAAESTVDYLQSFLEKKEKYKIKRYSPGFNDWKLYEQKKIFELIHPGKIGIKLNEACLMLPKKSVTGIMVKKGG